MPERLAGMHHVTAIAADPQRTLEFYTEVLGLRLVKRTVNYDDPGAYHLYVGDGAGSPGTLLTFFLWPGAESGRAGAGQVSAIALAIREESLGYWSERLVRAGAAPARVAARFQEAVLPLRDPDGLRLELVTVSGPRESHGWRGGPVPESQAILGLGGVTLREAALDPVADFLTGVLAFSFEGREGERRRFTTGPGGPKVDVVPARDELLGVVATGSVHHVAWAVAGDAEQLAWRSRVQSAGLHITPVIERTYFRSVYFREPGGVLFEIATDGPGFTVDEPLPELGTRLKLPPWLEPRRAEIEAALPALELPELIQG